MEFQTRGLGKSKRALEGTGNSAMRAGKRIKSLGAAMAALGGLSAGASLIKLGDDYKQLRNRIRLTTGSVKELNSVQNHLMRISRSTRTDVRTNAEVFNRMGLAVKGLSFSQADVIKATQALNAAMQVSGASADEASASIIQFTQGLASARLAGDEMRSIMEQTPKVIDVILQHVNAVENLNLARGDAKEIAMTGFFNPERVFGALISKAGDDAIKEFEETQKTMRQSITVLRNEFLISIGEYMDVMGVDSGLSRVLELISENAKGIVRILGAAGLLGAIATLGSAMGVLLTPFTATLAGLVGLMSNMDKIKLGVVEKTNVFAVDIMNSFLHNSIDTLKQVMAKSSEKMQSLLNLQEDGPGLHNIHRVLSGAVKGAIAFIKVNVLAGMVLVENLFIIGKQLFNKMTEIIERIYKKIQDLLQSSQGLVSHIRVKTGLDTVGPEPMQSPAPRKKPAWQSGADKMFKLALGDSLPERREGEMKLFHLGRGIGNFLGSMFEKEDPDLFETNDIALRGVPPRVKQTAPGLPLLPATPVSPPRDIVGESLVKIQTAFAGAEEAILGFTANVVTDSLQHARNREQSQRHLMKRLNINPDEEFELLGTSAFPAGGNSGKAGKPGQYKVDALIKELAIEGEAILKFSQSQLSMEQKHLEIISRYNHILTEGVNGTNEQIRKLLARNELAKIAAPIKERFTRSEDVIRQRAADMLLDREDITPRQHTLVTQENRLSALSESQTMMAGAERALIQLELQAADSAGNMESVLTNAFQGVEDALAKFVETGKLDFKSLVSSILSDMTRLAIKENITPLLAQGVRGALGMIGLSAPNPAAAAGGDSGGVTNVFQIQTPDAASFRTSIPQLTATAAGTGGR